MARIPAKQDTRLKAAKSKSRTRKPIDARRALGYYPPSGELHLEEWAQQRYFKRKMEAQASKPAATAFKSVLQTDHRPYRRVTNPQATLTGISTELRLEVYSYLSPSTLVHIHSSSQKGRKRFTWTPCKGTNPDHPLLCANAKWSGLCSEKERCTYKHAAPPEPRGFWGLAATCKSIRNEMQELFLKDCAFSVEPLQVQGWLCWMKEHAPKVFVTIRKLTLAGPEHHKHFLYDFVEIVKRHLPPAQLKAVGLQSQTPMCHWVSDLTTRPAVHINSRWRPWEVIRALEGFEARVSVQSESLIWIAKQTVVVNGKTTAVQEKQAIIRVTREGDQDGGDEMTWEAQDVNIEVEQPRDVVTGSRNAGWRLWWRAGELQFFGLGS